MTKIKLKTMDKFKLNKENYVSINIHNLFPDHTFIEFTNWHTEFYIRNKKTKSTYVNITRNDVINLIKFLENTLNEYK
jgi:hypothetical protein